MNEYYISNVVIPIVEDVHYVRKCDGKASYFEFDPNLVIMN